MREGLHPNRPTHVLRLTTDERSARAMTDFLGEVFDPADTAVAAFEDADGRWLLEAYFAQQPDEGAIRGLLRPTIGAGADAAVFETLAGTDWIRASLEGLTPVRAGRFLVHGSHDRACVRPNDRALEIEAALAFGTGHHGTTRGCLLALDAELKRRQPARILDLGTGTGVLALAAAKASKRRVVAGDIDAEAVRTARENAQLNGVRPFVTLYAAPGTRHPAANRRRSFDLVLANILARPLMRLAPSVERVLASRGTLILSGLIPRDVPGVLAAYAAQNVRLQRRRDLDGWATLTLRRGGEPARPAHSSMTR